MSNEDVHIMLDLESLGVRGGAVIATIGAVKFNLESGTIIDKTYIRIDVEDAQKCGFRIDAATVKWWMQQSDAARAELTHPVLITMRGALDAFSNFCNNGGFKELFMWGNGADFDCVLLAYAYDFLGIKKPWSFRNNRCLRTAKALLPAVEITNQGIAHNALDDALNQANYLIAAYRKNNESKIKELV